MAALQKMMVVKARVRRDGELREIPAQELVPGDIVSFEAGDLVTADGRIISAATLEIDEAALTGESLPTSKEVAPVAEDAPLGDRHDMAYMNTNVTRGSGQMVVVATGMTTEVGHISGMLQVDEDQETPLTRQINTLTNQLLIIAGPRAAGVDLDRLLPPRRVVRHAVRDRDRVRGVRHPERPAGGHHDDPLVRDPELAKAHAIVKQLRSVETLGSTSAINSDKTGTLTLNQMTAVEMAIPGRRYTISGHRLRDRRHRSSGSAATPTCPLDAFLLPCVLAADAVVKDGDLIGDPTEGALVVLAEKGGVSAIATRETYPRVATLPFDAAYKMMATFHAMKDERGRDVIRGFVKGAPDQLLARGTTVITPDLSGTSPVDDAMKQRFLDENERLGSKGLRVMATGRKDFDPKTFDANADLLPLLDGMTLLALVGIVDPPRPAAKVSIADAHSAGIQVRMITGDHAVTAEAIAKDLGIPGRAITGAEFRAMSDEEALAQLDDIGVIARVTPEDKVHLVDLLRMKGHIVAMTGDGVNDAPALKKADIGVAMGITGTEVSKEAANMILTDDDFSTIVKAVELGRGLYDNLKKYIRFQVGLLIGYIFTFLGSSILNVLGGVPFFPLQTLFMNFTIQVFQAVGLGYGKPSLGLMERKPRPSNEALLGRRLLVLARGRGRRDGPEHARRPVVGEQHVQRRRGRADDGHDHVLRVQRRVLVRDQGRAALRVQPRRHGRPAVPVRDAGVDRVHRADPQLRLLQPHPGHDVAVARAVGHLPRRRPPDPRRRRGPQARLEGRLRRGTGRRRAGDRAGRGLRWRTSRVIANIDDLRTLIKPLRVEPGRKVRLPKDFDPAVLPGRPDQEGRGARCSSGASSCSPNTRRGWRRRTRTACWSCSRRWTPPARTGPSSTS